MGKEISFKVRAYKSEGNEIMSETNHNKELQSAAVNTKEKTVTGLFWEYLEKLGGEAVSLVVSVVLARLLGPSAYGVIPLITVFTSLLGVLVQSGFGSALVQKKDADEKDFSTVFIFQLGLATIFFIGIVFAAPYIAAFYKNPDLTPMVRILSLTLIIGAVNNIQHAYVSKTMQFKKYFFASFTGTVLSGVAGVVVAFVITAHTNNPVLGAWALVTQKLTDHIVDTIFLWATVKWRPKLQFSFTRLKSLYSYGWKILVSSFIDTLYHDIRTLIIGKMYTSKDLAYYSKGSTYPKILMNNLNKTIQHVLFPALASHQDNIPKVKSMTRRAMKTSSYLVFPAMMGFAAVADQFIYLLLGEAWMPAVPFMWIACFNYAMWPIHTSNLQAIQAMGKSGTFLVAEIIKKISNLAFLGAGIAIAVLLSFESTTDSVIVIAMSSIIAEIVCVFINARPNAKILGYGLFEQLRDLMPAFLMSLIMGAVVFSVDLIPFHVIIDSKVLYTVIELIIKVILGIGSYLLLSVVFRVESFKYILSTLKDFKKKKKAKKLAKQ